jgi:hypothetical protein
VDDFLRELKESPQRYVYPGHSRAESAAAARRRAVKPYSSYCEWPATQEPSAIAAGALHMMRQFLLRKSAANPLELAAFSTLG